MLYPIMPAKPSRYRPFPKRPSPSQADRPTASQRGYGSRWQTARETYLDSHPLCKRCGDAGIVEEATVVDHIIPHKGNQALFWDVEGNWQPLCARCHGIKSATQDGGFGRTPQRLPT